jgi:hypothetical protein
MFENRMHAIFSGGDIDLGTMNRNVPILSSTQVSRDAEHLCCENGNRARGFEEHDYRVQRSILYHFIQFVSHASHPVFADPAINFFSIYQIF